MHRCILQQTKNLHLFRVTTNACELEPARIPSCPPIWHTCRSISMNTSALAQKKSHAARPWMWRVKPATRCGEIRTGPSSDLWSLRRWVSLWRCVIFFYLDFHNVFPCFPYIWRVYRDSFLLMRELCCKSLLCCFSHPMDFYIYFPYMWRA